MATFWQSERIKRENKSDFCSQDAYSHVLEKETNPLTIMEKQHETV